MIASEQELIALRNVRDAMIHLRDSGRLSYERRKDITFLPLIGLEELIERAERNERLEELNARS